MYPVNQDAETADGATRAFLYEIVKILLDYITSINDRDNKVLEFHHPIELRKMLDLKIGEDPEPLEKLLKDCKVALDHGVKTGTSLFVFHLSSLHFRVSFDD